METFAFRKNRENSGTKARLGEISTAHGIIQTPVFMPVGTQGTVKAMRTEELASMGAEIILGNTYHLYLRPGHQLIKKMGGLHRFMNWKGPILTDSGGYQVFSLGRAPEERQISAKDEANLSKRNTKLAKITDEGVFFQSHIDGSQHWITPEISIAIQEALGSDIMMVFDECTPYPASFDEAKKSMERTLSWEERSLKARTSSTAALFAIIQGGMYPELRKECLERLMEMQSPVTRDSLLVIDSIDLTSDERRTTSDERRTTGFQGFAIGGLSVGEPISQMYEMAEYCAGLIPENYPRYLMGVGMPEDLIRCIDVGIDMFDCVIPTRNARNGMLFTQTGFIYIKQAQFAEDEKPIDENCSCYTCCHYSKAYLRHLHMAKEILSSILSSIHNLHYYLNLIGQVRLAIKEGRFVQFKKEFFRERELLNT